MWRWPVVKYKHIKIKPRICVGLLFILCLTWTVNADSLKQNIIAIKEICSWLPPFCKQNLLLFIQPRWQLRRTGPAVVHFLVPGTCGTFEDYAKEVFLPYVVKKLDTVSRIDIVWDVYKSDSLKNATREKTGCGTRRRVSSSTRIPGNWPSLLRNNENKQKWS